MCSAISSTSNSSSMAVNISSAGQPKGNLSCFQGGNRPCHNRHLGHSVVSKDIRLENSGGSRIATSWRVWAIREEMTTEPARNDFSLTCARKNPFQTPPAVMLRSSPLTRSLTKKRRGAERHECPAKRHHGTFPFCREISGDIPPGIKKSTLELLDWSSKNVELR